jgi:hypothetical protein
LHTGSFHETIGFLVWGAIQPDVRAVLQNLVANVIWEFFVRSRQIKDQHLFHNIRNEPDPKKIVNFNSNDMPYGIDLHITDMISQLAKNTPNGARLSLQEYHSPRVRATDVELIIMPREEEIHHSVV